MRHASPGAAFARQRLTSRNPESLRSRILENPDSTPIARVAAKAGFDPGDAQRRRHPLRAEPRRDVARDQRLHAAMSAVVKHSRQFAILRNFDIRLMPLDFVQAETPGFISGGRRGDRNQGAAKRAEYGV